MIGQFSKYQLATFIAILFHVIGLTGILFSDNDFFVRSTPMNLLLMFALLVWTQMEKNSAFLLFLSACFITGVGVEIIGVNTGLLFGDYKYGKVLGIQLANVPLLIGVNWFIIIYCSGITIQTLLAKLSKGVIPDESRRANILGFLSVVIDGATLAVFFDWLMEPVAVKLNYWQWLGDGNIPVYNYICWFFVSVLLLLVFRLCKFEKQNKFAVNLLLIQFMFFLVLRTFMK